MNFFAANLAGLSLIALSLFGCASPRPNAQQFDLGPLPALASTPAASERTIKVQDISAPAWLDSQAMLYRLHYANAQQALPYANSRWHMPPPQMLTQRLKSRLAQAGVRVLAGNDGVVAPSLRIELDDFSQHFSQAQQSQAGFSWRVSLIAGRQLLAQKTFTQQVAAPRADAIGGAQALALASDRAIDELLLWLSNQPQVK
ncbi:MAG: membrane integrity-associated transporter subunit PqiC [Burkholderiales bacterium]|nr:membrane integrity-associated transporter subunit PqiC [Burkholderiales bacterium]